ncbi:MAG: outer membrane beta-barrel protein [Acidobacteriota bacterium]
MNRMVLTVMSLLVLSGSQALRAGDATIYAGFQNPGKLTIGNTVADNHLGTVVGARLSAGNFLGVIGIEPGFGYSPRFLEPGSSSTDLRAFNAHLNLLAGVTVDKINPYATVGVGFVNTWGDSVRDFGLKFALNYGGGIKFKRLMGPLGFRFDVRGYRIPAVFSQSLNMVEGSFGLLVSW